MSARTSRRPRIAARSLNTITEQPMAWGWAPVLPRQALSTIVGEPGQGKSLITCDLAARFTRGDAMPCGGVNGFGEPVNVLMLAVEDNTADTVIPRLRVANADMSRVFAMRMPVDGGAEVDAGLTFPNDIAELDVTIRDNDIRVIIVDPITACLSADVNAWRDTDVRRALGPVASLARAHDALAVAVMHVNKSEAHNPSNRVANSKAFTALPRANWMLGPDPSDPGHVVLTPLKVNVAARSSSYGFRIAESPDKLPYVVWDAAPGQLRAEDLVAPPATDEPSSIRETAIAFLLRTLRSGEPVDSQQLKAQASEQGIHERLLQRLANQFGIRAERTATVPSRTMWQWPLMTTG